VPVTPITENQKFIGFGVTPVTILRFLLILLLLVSINHTRFEPAHRFAGKATEVIADDLVTEYGKASGPFAHEPKQAVECRPAYGDFRLVCHPLLLHPIAPAVSKFHRLREFMEQLTVLRR